MPTPRIQTGPEAIASGVRELLAGGLVVFPTETVYGLGADAFNADAVARVFRVKGRPSGNPLIVHVSGPEMARRVVARWTDEAERLARAFWPGPLTLVLPRAADLPAAVTGGGDTVGVRCPDHPVALALIEASGTPIVGPSANPSGRISPTTAEHVAEGLGRGAVDDDAEGGLLIIDGGACRAGIESTVLDLTVDPPRILRPGVVGAEAIAGALGRASIAEGDGRSAADGPAASPGLMGPHYQPRTPVTLLAPGSAGAGGAGPGDALIAWSVTRRVGGVLLAIPADPAGYAGALYARLHEADRLGAGRILVEMPARPEEAALLGAFRAINERLGRAAAGDRPGDAPVPPPG
jgi:L-threonylcarbamoyladenylate synthase